MRTPRLILPALILPAFALLLTAAPAPDLLHGTPAQREAVEISRDGLHSDELDEDISIAGLLAGRGDQTRSQERAA
jgi:hypothetical protein